MVISLPKTMLNNKSDFTKNPFKKNNNTISRIPTPAGAPGIRKPISQAIIQEPKMVTHTEKGFIPEIKTKVTTNKMPDTTIKKNCKLQATVNL